MGLDLKMKCTAYLELNDIQQKMTVYKLKDIFTCMELARPLKGWRSVKNSVLWSNRPWPPYWVSSESSLILYLIKLRLRCKSSTKLDYNILDIRITRKGFITGAFGVQTLFSSIQLVYIHWNPHIHQHSTPLHSSSKWQCGALTDKKNLSEVDMNLKVI